MSSSSSSSSGGASRSGAYVATVRDTTKLADGSTRILEERVERVHHEAVSWTTSMMTEVDRCRGVVESTLRERAEARLGEWKSPRARPRSSSCMGDAEDLDAALGLETAALRNGTSVYLLRAQLHVQRQMSRLRSVMLARALVYRSRPSSSPCQGEGTIVGATPRAVSMVSLAEGHSRLDAVYEAFCEMAADDPSDNQLLAPRLRDFLTPLSSVGTDVDLLDVDAIYEAALGSRAFVPLHAWGSTRAVTAWFARCTVQVGEYVVPDVELEMSVLMRLFPLEAEEAFRRIVLQEELDQLEKASTPQELLAWNRDPDVAPKLRQLLVLYKNCPE